MKYEFEENNSGGSWWLSRQQYEALRAAGWHEPEETDDDKRFAASCLNTPDVPYRWRQGWWIEADSIREAVESWERATGEDFFAQGCNCCGAPFSISSDDYNERLSGDSVQHIARRPW